MAKTAVNCRLVDNAIFDVIHAERPWLPWITPQYVSGGDRTQTPSNSEVLRSLINILSEDSWDLTLALFWRLPGEKGKGGRSVWRVGGGGGEGGGGGVGFQREMVERTWAFPCLELRTNLNLSW